MEEYCVVMLEDYGEKLLSKVYVCGFKLDADERNKWFLSKKGKVWQFEGAYSTTTNNVTKSIVRGRKILSTDDLFTWPNNSSDLNIFKSDGNLSSKISEINIRHVRTKLFAIEEGTKQIFISMINE